MFKKLLYFSCLLFSVLNSDSQNLVRNGSFDSLTTCPTAQGQLNYVYPWQSARGTCDLYNTCNTGQFGVPYNQAGNQLQKSGNGYSGFFATQGYFEVREYLYAPLKDSLKAGHQYCLSFYVVLADSIDSFGDQMYDVAVNDIGAYFTSTAQTPQPSNFNHYAVTPQVKNPHTNPLTSRTNWTQISGSFTAAGGEKYILIGSFSDMATQDTTWLDPWNSNNWAYYLVEDVSLVDCSTGLPLTASVTGVNQICKGQSTTLTASASGGTPGYTYNWTGLPGGAVQIVSPSVSTVYTVTVTDTTGTSTVQQYTVTVVPLPIAFAGNDTSICSGSSANLNASGGGSYSWSNGANTASTVVSPTVTTNYVVTVTSSGCANSDTVKVTVISSPSVNAGPDVTICNGQSTVLTATGSVTYLWSTGAMSSSIVVSPASTTYYSVTGFNGSCTNKDSVQVTVVPFPVANAGSDVTICKSQTATLTASGGGSYLWNTGAITQSISVSPINTSTYVVTVSNGICSKTDSAIVTVVPAPVANAGSDTTICNGASAVLTGQGGGSYQWNTGSSSQTITVSPAATTNYIVTVSNSFCSDKDTVRVTVKPNPTVNAGKDTSICVNQNVILYASGGATYQWNTGATTNNIQVAPQVTTLYWVTASNGTCTASDSVEVFVKPLGTGDCQYPASSIIAPNIFTPNGDGVNDYFQIETINIISFECTIYNRWGQAINTLQGVNDKWGGITGNGEPVSAGTYYFIINAKGQDNKQYNLKGFIELIR